METAMVDQACLATSWAEVIQAKQQLLQEVATQEVHRRKMKNLKAHSNLLVEKEFLLDLT